jgi:hypothetical protein
MDLFIRILFVLHFLGLAMGLATGFSMLVMGPLIDRASASEKGVLGRFPPLMSRIGSFGLLLLWLSGLGLLQFKWGGFGNMGSMPWQFHAKLLLVIILSGLIGFLQGQQRRATQGDMSAMKNLKTFGPVAFLTAVTIVIFAVFAFE